MHEIIPNPKKYIGKKVNFVAFYAPSNNRPSFFMSEESWLIGDLPSAIVVSSITEDLYLAEKSSRFSYVRVSGVIGIRGANSMEPHITIQDVEIRVMLKPESMEAVRNALKSEADIGFTEEEYYRLGIEGGHK